MKNFGEKTFITALLLTLLSSTGVAQELFFHLLGSSTEPYTWTGQGADANWTTIENWSTKAVPGVSDTAHFVGSPTCISNCSPTMNTNINIRGMDIQTGYAGTITQGAGQTIAIGTGGWNQAAGNFNGSSGSINVVGAFRQLAGSFTATSGTLTIQNPTVASQTLLTIASGATFSHNNGTVSLYGTGVDDCFTYTYTTDVANSATFYNLYLSGNSGVTCIRSAFTTAASTKLVVLNSLTHGQVRFHGTAELQGNLTLVNAQGGPGTITLNKTTGGQTYGGSGTTGNIVVNNSSGAVTPAVGTTSIAMGTLNVIAGNFTAPTGVLTVQNTVIVSQTFLSLAAGTVFNHNSGTLQLIGRGEDDCNTYTYTTNVANSATFYNVQLDGNSHVACIRSAIATAASTNLEAENSFTHNQVMFNGVAQVRGSVAVGATAKGGTGTIAMSSPTASSITFNTGGVAAAGLFTIGKNVLANTVTATTNINLTAAGSALNIDTGTLDLAGNNLNVNTALTIGANAKLICNGGAVTAGSYVLNGEISCGTSIGITWTGATGDGLWTTAGNWTNNTVPTLNDVAIFNAKCVGANCNVNINAAVDVKGISMTSVYAGTITQASGNSIYVRSSGWTQAAGIFAGSNSAITLADGGAFTLTAGTFTSTSGTLSIINGDFTVSGSPVFGVNSGTVTFTRTGGGTNTIRANGIAFNNVNIVGYGANHNLNAETLIVNGLLTVGDTDGSGEINNGNVSARGDVTLVNLGKGGTATIKIAGTTNQTITGVVSARIPNLEVASTGGTVSFVGILLFAEADYTLTSGTVDAGTSTLLFTSYNGSNKTLTPGTAVYNDVIFRGNVLTTDLAGGNMTVNGLLTLDASAGGGINNGTITARGNVTSSSQGKGGTATVKIAGTGNQTVSGVVAARFPSVEIASTGGIVTFSGNLLLTKNYTYTSGTVDSGTSTLTIYNNVETTTITPGPVAYNNVTFAGFSSTFSLAASTMTVLGTLTVGDTYNAGGKYLNSGTILANGNVVFNNYGYPGTALIKIAGTINQTVTGISGAAIPNFELASTGGTVTYSGYLYLTENYTYTSGTVDAGTSTLRFFNNVDNSTIIPGAVAYNNVTISGFAATFSLATNAMTVNGTLTMGDTYSSNPKAINSGTLLANGNVVFTNYGYPGTAVLNFVGSTSSTLQSVSTATITTPSILINKSGGATVAMTSNVNFNSTSQSLSLTGGTLDLGGWDLGVNNVLTVGAGAILKCNGGVFSVGSLSNSGTINCPGYAAYDFNWTGAGGNSNWNNAGNWQTGVAPGAGDVASFESTYCGANCNATVNVNPAIKGVRIYSTYTHTITQAPGVAMNIGSRGWIQDGGTFAGGNSAITYSGNFELSGGTYSAPASAIYPLTNFIVTGSPTFNAGTSTLEFTEGGIITPGTVTYNNVSFPHGTNWNAYNLSGGDLKVGGTLNSSFGAWNSEARTINNGTISAYGNVNISSYGIVGTSTIVMAGNASGQTLAVTGTVGQLPNFAIAGGANPVTLTGLLNIRGNYTFTSVGTLTSAGSTMNFVGDGGTITPGTITYSNNVRFGYAENYGAFNLAGGNFKIGGTLDLSAGGWTGDSRVINNGTISAYGNVTVSSRGAIGTSTLLIAGNSLGQTITSTAGWVPNFEVAAGANPVTFVGTLNFANNYTMTSVGTFTATGSTLNFGGDGTSITPGSVTYNNVSFSDSGSTSAYNLGAGNFIVGGDLNISYGPYWGQPRTINNGTFNVYGNVIVSSRGAVGTSTVVVAGNASGQTISASGVYPQLPNLNINSGANSVSMGGTVYVNNATSVTTGAPNMAGASLNTLSLALAGNTLTKSGGVLTVNGVVAGTGSLYGGTVNP